MIARRPWLLPLVPLYSAGLACKNRASDHNPGRSQRLRNPVVSIGSLSAGGAGKTPFTLALGEALRRAGYGIDVLSRGHGRTSSLNLRVDPNGTAEDFGDEPLLLARQLACPVYVGSERFRAGDMAERDRRVRLDDRYLSLHLLDDGFQHRQLHRAVDIVLLTAEDVNDMLLPAGNLREPLRALMRADVVVLRAEEAGALLPVLRRVLRPGSTVKQWNIERRVAIIEHGCAQRPLAFCGLARPNGFRASLQELRIECAGFVALRDHQRYSPAVVDQLCKRARHFGADGFVTTAKDAVKLTEHLRRQLRAAGPLLVCDVAVSLMDEAGCVRDVLGLVNAELDRRVKP